jgi:hypothetical protein
LKFLDKVWRTQGFIVIPAFFGLKKADKFPVSGYETVKKPREAMCGKSE